jgi:hypothetical protein
MLRLTQQPLTLPLLPECEGRRRGRSPRRRSDLQVHQRGAATQQASLARDEPRRELRGVQVSRRIVTGGARGRHAPDDDRASPRHGDLGRSRGRGGRSLLGALIPIPLDPNTLTDLESDRRILTTDSPRHHVLVGSVLLLRRVQGGRHALPARHRNRRLLLLRRMVPMEQPKPPPLD